MIALPDGFGLSVPGAAVALALALLTLVPFASALPQAGFAPALWAALGAALFAVAVFVVQVPLQRAVDSTVTNGVSPFWLGAHLWALPLALALIAAVLQEGGRLGAIAIALRIGRRRAPLPALGATVGGGVGLLEAAMVLGAIPPGSFHVLSVAVLERVGAVAFHVGAGAVLGAGIARARLGAAFALTTLVHALVDGLASLFAVGLTSLFLVEAVNLAAGLGLLALGAWSLRYTRPAAAASPSAAG